jgi:hypothetical protein
MIIRRGGARCDEGTQDSNIKTILFILRTIDTEEGRLGRTGVDPYILKPETGTSNHVTMSVSATSWLDRHITPPFEKELAPSVSVSIT